MQQYLFLLFIIFVKYDAKLTLFVMFSQQIPNKSNSEYIFYQRKDIQKNA